MIGSIASRWLPVVVVLVSLVRVGSAQEPAVPLAARSAASKPLPWLPEGVAAQCLFLPRTAIPMLAMGVRRTDDDAEIRGRRLLDLWKQPAEIDPAAEPLTRVPLFRPLYVYDRRSEGGEWWFLLGDEYVGSPLGWADGSHLHVLDSRYGYCFSNPDRAPPGVQLYGSRAAAYAAIDAPANVGPGLSLDGVIVSERMGLKRLREEVWNPLAANSVAPFVELPPDDEGDARQLIDRGLTDTTLTFPFPRDNRLLRIGAVAGGPVDVAELAKKKSEAAERAGVSIAFVIDETVSMKKYFPEVAAFIDENLELEEGVNIRVAVSWYSDVEKDGDRPYEAQKLEQLSGPGLVASDTKAKKARIVGVVRERNERVIKGYGAQERELIYQGLIAAIQRAGFEPGENAMVFVVGDAADRTQGRDLEALQDNVAELVAQHKLQLAFVQVGELGPDFADQAMALRDRMPQGLRDAVLVRGVGDGSLRNQLADLRAQMERRRERLLGEIAEMETRNQFSQPGPVLEKQLQAAGIDRAEFDRRHLQFFTPAWGWLYPPRQSEAAPQLRELVWITDAEAFALVPALATAVEGLRSKGQIDLDATRGKISTGLSKRTGHTAVSAALDAAWRSLPEGDRTLGRFLRDGMGLRVRNAILFHRGVADPRAEPTSEGIKSLLDSRSRLGMTRPPGVNWADAWKVLP